MDHPVKAGACKIREIQVISRIRDSKSDWNSFPLVQTRRGASHARRSWFKNSGNPCNQLNP